MNKFIQYSICATIHNYGYTIERNLGSNVERAATDQMEFVGCDSRSSNATLQEMSNYSMLFKVVKILSIKCSRKKGRRFAFENTTGGYPRAKAEICESELRPSKRVIKNDKMCGIFGILRNLYWEKCLEKINGIRALPSGIKTKTTLCAPAQGSINGRK